MHSTEDNGEAEPMQVDLRRLRISAHEMPGKIRESRENDALVQMNNPGIHVTRGWSVAIFGVTICSFGVANVHGEVAEERVVEDGEHSGAKGEGKGEGKR